MEQSMKLKMQAQNRAFTVRIWGALEMKFWKSAKLPGIRSFRGQRLHLVEDADRLQDHRAADLQALGAQLIDRVLNRVVKNVVVSVINVDDVGAGHSDANKRQMIVDRK